ncbi:DMT family transporter [Breznakiella homolactica]|uniref:EamA family transporter n=1 Tax=Breznakiella homolactica TaxID=2798577 RepID=A0A7T7XKE4_9SPIR|nr:DMT family transporter [Breznakiella homolactica]QQO08024.1 DMT family transporter [Breznakiella homolactica]
MRQTVKGQLAIVICAVLWSTSGLFIKLIDWHPFVIAGLRSAIAAAFMLAVRGLSRRRVPGRAAPGAFWGAGISYAATLLLFVTANKMTSSANAILLQYSAPVWAAILGWILLKEKPGWEHWAALGAVVVGLLLFFREGLARGSLLGDGIALLSGVCFGANSVFMRMQKDGSPADSMILAHTITAAVGIPFIFAAPPEVTIPAVSALLFMGVFQIGTASVLFSYGIRRVTAIQAMLTAMVEPVLNPLWVLLVTGERPGALALAGGGIIIAAVAMASLAGAARDSRMARTKTAG